MHRLAATFLLLAVVSSTVFPAQPASFEYSGTSVAPRLRWSNKTIKVTLSRSLRDGGTNIKLESDVLSAVRRALLRWSAVTEIQFEVNESNNQSISPANAGDGISLITIADTPQNNAIFSAGGVTGRTRVFFDKTTGEISEADIAINPHPTSADGLPVYFSTDGTRGTYDLESTFTHEIGHLLGLDHSQIISSTMHPHQALNGVYNKPAFTERTLSEEDRSRVRGLYGPLNGFTVMEGRISRLDGVANQSSLAKAEVWVEDSFSGRIIASTSTSAGGRFRLDNLLPTNYRLLSTNLTLSTSTRLPNAIGSSNDVVVNASNDRAALELWGASHPNRYLNPRFVGAEGELSTTPVPIDAGKRLKLFVAGEGLDQISADGVTITSPFFKVDPASVQKETFPTPYPVISFEVSAAANAPFGDYTIRLQSKTSEIAYVPGALTIDPGVESSYANPADDPQFFVRQQYRDVLVREADESGLNYWVNQLNQCGKDALCLRDRRVKISSAFFSEEEFQQKSGLVHRVYLAALGRVPSFNEFVAARDALAGTTDSTGNAKKNLALLVSKSEEFQKLYPSGMTAADFVNGLIGAVRENTGVNVSNRTSALIALAKTSQGRANVIQEIADATEFIEAEHDRAFVLMQFFAYLQRDPSHEDLKLWLSTLAARRQNDPARFTAVTCAFVNSAEYQSRFGMLVTHHPSECDAQ